MFGRNAAESKPLRRAFGVRHVFLERMLELQHNSFIPRVENGEFSDNHLQN